MPEYKLKTRIQNKYKTLVEWNSIQEGEFIPLKGEVCYAVDNGTLYQKIGDGTTDFTKLDWLNGKQVQADWNENDINSAAYIYNKICGIEPESVPENEQETGYFPRSKNLFSAELIPLADVGINPEDIGLSSTVTHAVQLMPNEGYIFYNSQMGITLQNSADEFVAIIEDPEKKYSFNVDTSNYLSMIVDDETPVTAFLIGNPQIANLFLQGMEVDAQFPLEKNLDADYALLIAITTIPNYTENMGSVIFMGDAAVYNSTDVSNITFSLKRITQNTVRPIDGKYLTNAWSDQFEMDATKPSFIKNRYGDLAQMRIQDQEDPESAANTIFQASCTVYRNNGNNIKITTNNISNNLPIYGLHGKAELYYEILSYDVQINGVWYKNCPLIRASNLLTKGSTFYFIGNPKLISTAYGLASIEAIAPNLDYTKICSMEDNGIPFLLIIDEDLNSANFLDDFIYGTEEWISTFKVNDTIDIIIAEAFISIATHMIPPHLLPYELSITNWVFNESKNTIASKSAKIASGVNSFAIGTSTQATGISSVAIGNNTQATGLNAFAGGSSSIAAGSNSFAFGSGAWTNVANQFAIGKYNSITNSPLFMIGNGVDASNRSNAFEVYSNGNVKASGSISANSVETSSVVLISPNGTKFTVSIDNDGVLTATEIVKE